MLGVFLLVSAVLVAACVGAELYCRHTASLNHLPYTYPTLAPSDDYADYLMFVGRFHFFHQEAFFSPNWGSHFLYPATVGVLSTPFYLFPPPSDPEVRFLAELCFCMVLVILWFRRALIQRGLSRSAATLLALGTAVMSYPFYFEFNRANVEFFVWVFTGLGVLAFFRDKPWRAATWIGIAGACKFYPFVYLGLLIARKQYKQAAWSLVAGGLVTLFSLWALTGNIAFTRAQTAAGVAEFRWVYVLHRRVGEIGLDHSIFGFYKRFAPHLPPPEQLGHTLTIYLAVAALVACVVFFAGVLKLPPINQVIFLTAAALLLPPVSYDYTLQHLYTPFVLMVFLAIDLWKRGDPLPSGTWAAFLCFMLLLAPLNEFIFHGERIQAQLKCLILLALAAISLCYPFVTPQARPEGTLPA